MELFLSAYLTGLLIFLLQALKKSEELKRFSFPVVVFSLVLWPVLFPIGLIFGD